MDQRLGHPFIANHGGFEHRLIIEAVGPLTMTGLELLKNARPIDRIIEELQDMIREKIADYLWLTPLSAQGPPRRC